MAKRHERMTNGPFSSASLPSVTLSRYCSSPTWSMKVSFMPRPQRTIAGSRFTSSGRFSKTEIVVCPCLFFGALGEAAAEDAFGDAVLEDFDRAAGDHPAAAAARTVLDQFFLAVAHRAHHLERLVGDIEAGAVAMRLGDLGLLR